MSPSSIQLQAITIAAVNVEAMVNFYNHVFDSGLEPFAAFGTTLYRGQLAGLRLVFCPNEFLGIQADKNRQQLTFAVPDVEAIVRTAVDAGGWQVGELSQSAGQKVGSIVDPDGNTIELVDTLRVA